jgi:hypothetical protein
MHRLLHAVRVQSSDILDPTYFLDIPVGNNSKYRVCTFLPTYFLLVLYEIANFFLLPDFLDRWLPRFRIVVA